MRSYPRTWGWGWAAALALAVPAAQVRAENVHAITSVLGLSDRVETREWSSGRKHGMDDWVVARCWGMAPPATPFSPRPYEPMIAMVFGLTPRPEPEHDLDDFVAGLSVLCASLEFEGKIVHPFASAEEVLFRGDWSREPPVPYVTPPHLFAEDGSQQYSLATGLRLRTNAGKAYVKQLEFLGIYLTPESMPDWPREKVGDPSPPDYDHGPTIDLRCPPHHLLAGLGVRVDTSSSKIRDVRIYCKELIEKG